MINDYIFNNLTFVKCLDEILKHAFTYHDHNLKLEKRIFILNGDDKYADTRSTHMYKGMKNFLIDSTYKNEHGIIQPGKPLKLPYYNSTSTNIYKGCYYSSSEEDPKNLGANKGHLFLIKPDPNLRCIDYLGFINLKQDKGFGNFNHLYDIYNKYNTIKEKYKVMKMVQHNSKYTLDKEDKFIQLLSNNQVDMSQFDYKNKYIYEQEVLFERYTSLNNIEYIGTIKYILNTTSTNKNVPKFYVYESDKKVSIYTRETLPQYQGKKIGSIIDYKDKLLNDPTRLETDLFLNNSGELFNNIGTISKTFNYVGFRSGATNVKNSFQNDNLNFYGKFNLDPLKDTIEDTLKNILGTHVYKCDLKYDGSDGPHAGGGQINLSNNNNLYYKKYLKYKMKYLELKDVN